MNLKKLRKKRNDSDMSHGCHIFLKMKRIPVFLIRFYRNRLSRLKRKPCCKYYPSCSEYALKAYETHGFLKATAMTVWRLLRCNPWSMGGVDYVPGTPERIDFLARQKKCDADATEKIPSKRSK